MKSKIYEVEFSKLQICLPDQKHSVLNTMALKYLVSLDLKSHHTAFVFTAKKNMVQSQLLVTLSSSTNNVKLHASVNLLVLACFGRSKLYDCCAVFTWPAGCCSSRGKIHH